MVAQDRQSQCDERRKKERNKKMMPVQLVDYKGSLGVFSYDPNIFEVRKKYTPYGALQVLQYKGRETDGSLIAIPEGVQDCSYMFEGKSLITPPRIPSGVIRTNYMFLNCTSLERGAILPYGVRTASCMYRGCLRLQYVPRMCESLQNASYMFDGCRSLEMPPVLNEGLQNISGMFRNCFQLQEVAVVPSSVQLDAHVYRGCRKLKEVLGNQYEDTDVNFSVEEAKPLLYDTEVDQGVSSLTLPDKTQDVESRSWVDNPYQE